MASLEVFLSNNLRKHDCNWNKSKRFATDDERRCGNRTMHEKCGCARHGMRPSATTASGRCAQDRHARGRQGRQGGGVSKIRVIRCSSADIHSIFEDWVASERAAGARLLVLEGAMGSGKSDLTKEPIVVGDRQSANIAVDHFARGARNSVKRVPLAAAMKASLAMSPVVIVQGAMVWPLVQGIVEEIGAARVRRVYLKRMKWSNPDRWHDGSQFLEAAAPRHLGEYSNSIDRYHRDHQPWRCADLIFGADRSGRRGRSVTTSWGRE